MTLSVFSPGTDSSQNRDQTTGQTNDSQSTRLQPRDGSTIPTHLIPPAGPSFAQPFAMAGASPAVSEQQHLLVPSHTPVGPTRSLPIMPSAPDPSESGRPPSYDEVMTSGLYHPLCQSQQVCLIPSHFVITLEPATSSHSYEQPTFYERSFSNTKEPPTLKCRINIPTGINIPIRKIF